MPMPPLPAWSAASAVRSTSLSTSPLKTKKLPSSSLSAQFAMAPAVPSGSVLDGVVDPQTVAGAVADLRLDGLGEEARGEDGALHAVPREVVEDVGDERALDHRCDRLGHARRDRAAGACPRRRRG